MHYILLYYVLARVLCIYVYTETKNWAHNYYTIYIYILYVLRRVLYRLSETIYDDHRVQNNDCPPLRSPPPMSLVVFSVSSPSSRRHRRHSYNRQLLPSPLPITRARCVITTLYIIHPTTHYIICSVPLFVRCRTWLLSVFSRHNIFFPSIPLYIPQPLPTHGRPTDFIPAAVRLMSLCVFNDPPPLFVCMYVLRAYIIYIHVSKTCHLTVVPNFNGGKRILYI